MSPAAVTALEGAFRSGRLRLHYRGWENRNAAAALIIVHGLAEHGGRYETVGRLLASSGISTWALDQRGHGLSGGRRGHTSRFDRFLEDLDRFLAELRVRVDARLPAFLLGHSLGGLVVLRHLEERNAGFRGAVIVSPWLGTAVAVPAWKRALAPALGRIVPALPFRAHIPAEFLSHDAEIVQAYRADPLVHDTVTPRLFNETTAAMERAFERADRIRVPLLFLIAGADRIVDAERSRAFALSLGGTDVDVRVLEGMYHEVLNEPDSGRVVGEIADWVLARSTARPA